MERQQISLEKDLQILRINLSEAVVDPAKIYKSNKGLSEKEWVIIVTFY